VDPTVVGPKVFKDGKYDIPLDVWNDFLKNKMPDEKKASVFRRRGTFSGCFAVDLDVNCETHDSGINTRTIS